MGPFESWPSAWGRVWGWGRLFDDGHPPDDVGAGDGVGVVLQPPSAQSLDGRSGGVQLFLAVGGLHGQEPAAHPHEGEAQLAQHPQVGHRRAVAKSK